MKRRKFIKHVAATAALGKVSANAWNVPGGEKYVLKEDTAGTDILAACPLCDARRHLVPGGIKRWGAHVLLPQEARPGERLAQSLSK